MKDTIKRIQEDIAKLKEQADINHEDIAELSRQTMRQHEALKNILLDKGIMSRDEYINHRKKAFKDIYIDEDRGTRVVCDHCLQVRQTLDELPIEYDFTHKERSKISEWVAKHKEKCNGKILVQDKKGEKFEEWKD